MEINLNIRDRLGKSFDLATFEEIKTFFDAEKKYWLEQKSNLGKNLSSPFNAYSQQIENFLVALQSFEDLVSQSPQPNNIQ